VTALQGTAVWFTSPRKVELRSAPLPSIKPDQVKVRTLFSAISHGTERLAYRGEIDPLLPLDLPTFQGSFRYPLKYGYACTGVVEEVGPQVIGIESGNLVFALHPHQDRFVLDASLVTTLPQNLDPALGVYFAQVETAVNVLLDAAPKSRETVVVFGQGVVGLLITSLLARLDLEHLITVDSFPARRDTALHMGATQVLSPDDDVPAIVRSLTSDRGADCVIEVSGAPAALNVAIDCAAVQGDVVVASWYGQKPVELQLGSAFHRRRLRLVSSQVGMLNPSLGPRWDRARRTETVRSLLPQLNLPLVQSSFVPFQDAAAAYERIDSRPDELVQVILSYDDQNAPN
jgi:2-desacetyl-2-hydroxyethyl bacteriochlorophyllide A dehydrogenase